MILAVRLNLYLSRYRIAFAFSNFLYPHSQQVSLRLPCPDGHEYGFTVFHINNNEGLGANYFPMVLLSSFGYTQKPKLTMLPFG
jgi:hypothetical protein